MAMTRCKTCWYDLGLCVCNREDQSYERAYSFMLVASMAPTGPVHPKDKERAIEWIRLCAIQDGLAPTAYMGDPWCGPPMDKAVNLLTADPGDV